MSAESRPRDRGVVHDDPAAAELGDVAEELVAVGAGLEVDHHRGDHAVPRSDDAHAGVRRERTERAPHPCLVGVLHRCAVDLF